MASSRQRAPERPIGCRCVSNAGTGRPNQRRSAQRGKAGSIRLGQGRCSPCICGAANAKCAPPATSSAFATQARRQARGDRLRQSHDGQPGGDHGTITGMRVLILGGTTEASASRGGWWTMGGSTRCCRSPAVPARRSNAIAWRVAVGGGRPGGTTSGAKVSRRSWTHASLRRADQERMPRCWTWRAWWSCARPGCPWQAIAGPKLLTWRLHSRRWDRWRGASSSRSVNRNWRVWPAASLPGAQCRCARHAPPGAVVITARGPFSEATNWRCCANTGLTS